MMCMCGLIDARNYAQQGCVMQFSGIILIPDGNIVPHSTQEIFFAFQLVCLLWRRVLRRKGSNRMHNFVPLHLF